MRPIWVTCHANGTSGQQVLSKKKLSNILQANLHKFLLAKTCRCHNHANPRTTQHKKMSPSKLIFPAACSAYSQVIWFGDGSTSVKSAIRLYSVCATGACRRLCRSSCSPSVFTAMAALSFIKFCEYTVPKFDRRS